MLKKWEKITVNTGAVMVSREIYYRQIQKSVSTELPPPEYSSVFLCGTETFITKEIDIVDIHSSLISISR